MNWKFLYDLSADCDPNSDIRKKVLLMHREHDSLCRNFQYIYKKNFLELMIVVTRYKINTKTSVIFIY